MMFNANRRSLFVFLAFVGMLVTLTDAHAFGRRCRCKQTQCQPECVTENITEYCAVTEAVLANPTVSGKIYDHMGQPLNTKVFVYFKDKNDVPICDTQEAIDGSYNIEIPGTPTVPNNILKVSFKRENGSGSVEYKVSYRKMNHTIHPIVPE